MKTLERNGVKYNLIPMLCDMKDIMWYDWLKNELDAIGGKCDDDLGWIAYDGCVFKVEQSNTSSTIYFELVLEGKEGTSYALRTFKAMCEYCNNYDINENYCYTEFRTTEEGWSVSFYKPEIYI